MRIESGTRQQVPDFFIFVENGGCMKTLFVLYMLTLNYGQTPQVIKLDTFDSSSQCSKTSLELWDFYQAEKVVKNKAGIVIFKCIEKKIYSDGCESGE